jgi:hypothetical protein
LSIETDDNIQQAIETVVENGTLRIRTAKNNLKLDTRTMKIVVTARNLDKLSIGGSGTVTADKLRGEKLTIDVGGSGAINIGQMESESVAIALGGSGSLKASGTTERLQVSIGGSGRVQSASCRRAMPWSASAAPARPPSGHKIAEPERGRFRRHQLLRRSANQQEHHGIRHHQTPGRLAAVSRSKHYPALTTLKPSSCGRHEEAGDLIEFSLTRIELMTALLITQPQPPLALVVAHVQVMQAMGGSLKQ